MLLRPARPGEAGLLTDLALRSKAHWGYDAAFMASCREELRIRPDDVVPRRLTVAERDGVVVGLYAIDGGPPVAELGQMFVDPGHIGCGVGSELWRHAVRAAAALGIRTLTVDADPFAEGFYLAMGAVRVGHVPSGSIPGRELPRLEFVVSSG